MAWTTPILIEICVGLEINGYLPAEFSSSEPLLATTLNGASHRYRAGFGGGRCISAMELPVSGLRSGVGR